MSRVCEFTGARPTTGNNVSHSQVKTKKTWSPNLVTKKFYLPSLDKRVKITLSASALRTMKKYGNMEELIKRSKADNMSDTVAKLKTQLTK